MDFSRCIDFYSSHLLALKSDDDIQMSCHLSAAVDETANMSTKFDKRQICFVSEENNSPLRNFSRFVYN